MEEVFRTGDPVFIDPVDGPQALRGIADRVRRDDGGSKVELEGLGQVPRAWVRQEQRSNRKRPWSDDEPQTLPSSLPGP
jgi:hypothetical protein